MQGDGHTHLAFLCLDYFTDLPAQSLFTLVLKHACTLEWHAQSSPGQLLGRYPDADAEGGLPQPPPHFFPTHHQLLPHTEHDTERKWARPVQVWQPSCFLPKCWQAQAPVLWSHPLQYPSTMLGFWREAITINTYFQSSSCITSNILVFHSSSVHYYMCHLIKIKVHHTPTTKLSTGFLLPSLV